MTIQQFRFQLYFLTLAAILPSSWAGAATPPEAKVPREAGEGSSEPRFVAQAGGIVSPGFGASVALEARVVEGLHLGLQGGFFSDERNGYLFVGPRASYRINVTDWLRLVPTFGVAHVAALAQDTDPYRVRRQTPISLTAGAQLAALIGQFLVGCEAQLLPVHTTDKTSDAPDAETREQTLYPVPVAIFVGATF